MIDNSRYDAFGAKTGETGTVANQYLFAGEQYDQNLSAYYLRQRYYDDATGRFSRRDEYEGKAREPLTLHKYLYANANPTHYTDPSGFASGDQGTDVAALIKLDFFAQDPLSRGGEIPIKGIWNRIGIDPSLIPYRAVNRMRRDSIPDLVDFRSRELYEIGSLKDREIKIRKMNNVYLPGVNDALSYLGRSANWQGGESFIPPSVVITRDGAIALVLPPVQGVISYQILNDGYYVATLALAIYVVSELALLAAEYVGLKGLTRGLAV